MINSKIIPNHLAALALLTSASFTFADVTVPTIPTNGPGVPTSIPTIPTNAPAVPTSSTTIPTSVPTIPTGTTSRYVYTFSGFRAPIVDNGITNTTKGKSVRFGFNLTDQSGTNVTNPAVVVDRFYKEVDCNTNAAISGLNPAGIKLNKTTWNKGRKDLEFSWTVPNLRKSCLQFTVVFDDAQTATAKFYVK